MEEDRSSRYYYYYYYFLNPRERGLYRVRALLARQRFFVAPNAFSRLFIQDVFRVGHPTEYTQDGNGHFLAYVRVHSIMMVKSAQPVEVHYIFHHQQRCGVRSRSKGRYSPYFSSSPLLTQWVILPRLNCSQVETGLLSRVGVV